ncbi:MAG: hypothetical protein PHO61_01765 [Candidatus ainarchaeum sp.]|nr:hypothetical protein [Candidatus ainarchaeum sp.]
MDKKWRNLLTILVIIIALVVGYLVFTQFSTPSVDSSLKNLKFSSFIEQDNSMIDSKINQIRTMQGLNLASKDYAEIEVLALQIIKGYNSAKEIESNLVETDDVCVNIDSYKEISSLMKKSYSDSNLFSQKLSAFSDKYPAEYANLDNSLYALDDLKFVSFEETDYLIGLGEGVCMQ